MRRKTIIECLKKIAGPHPEYARVLWMIVDGYTSEEICHKLAIKRNTCYVWLFRGRKLLKECLKEGGAL
jgi:DNA-directed RNA polymerase specialized sigma24 family protein